jgi:molybdenum cofactor biosynthesis protein MoaC
VTDFSHLDAEGNARMVDVSSKRESHRMAEAATEVLLGRELFEKVEQHQVEKGDVLAVARIAGIQAAKRTSELIPLCHQIPLSHVDIYFVLKKESSSIEIRASVKSTGVTGVEMEALTAATVAALTVYDMCKAISKSIRITDIHLVSKTGGKSGEYHV